MMYLIQPQVLLLTLKVVKAKEKSWVNHLYNSAKTSGFLPAISGIGPKAKIGNISSVFFKIGTNIKSIIWENTVLFCNWEWVLLPDPAKACQIPLTCKNVCSQTIVLYISQIYCSVQPCGNKIQDHHYNLLQYINRDLRNITKADRSQSD